MTEINKKLDLATIPPTNNDGDPYILPLDIFKEGYSAYNISNWFKGRVGDNGTPFAIRWYSHGRLLNILGLRPFIEGQVGDYTIDDSDPDNPQINMAEDASHVHIVGDVNDTQEGGVAIYRLISQAFPKSGIFYGKIGFMGTQDDGTLVNTGVDIVFKVLAGHMNMLGARKFYVSELEKAWLDLQAKIKKYQAEYKDATDKQAEQFKEDTEKALADLNTKITNEIKRAEDTLGDTQASIDANIASLKTLAAEIASLEAKIKDLDFVGTKQYDNDMDNLRQIIELKLSQISYTPEAFPTAQDIQNTYPHGKAGIFVAMDTGHKWIYYANSWRDCGVYQGTALDDATMNQIAQKVPVESNYWTVKSKSFDKANAKADNNAYLMGEQYPAGHVKSINLKIDTVPSDAKLWIFKYSSSDLTTKNLAITLVKEYDIHSPEVDINEDFDFPFLIGIKCENAAYYGENIGVLSRTLGQIKLGDTYEYPLTDDKTDFAIKVLYQTIFNIDTQRITGPFLNANTVGYDENVYPIVFDFTQNKATVDGFIYIKNKLSGSSSLHELHLSLDLTPLDHTSELWQNYLFIKNGDEYQVKKIIGGGLLNPANMNDYSIIAGISVDTPTDPPYKVKCYFYNKNANLVKAIFHKPQSDATTEFFDIVTQKIIDRGLYHYTYRAMGDSITHAENPDDEYKSAIGHRYTDWVSKAYGMFAYNYGVGGTHIAHTDNGEGMVDRIEQLGGSDIISIFGGTNDCLASEPIGTVDDGDLTHFAPAFDACLKKAINLSSYSIPNPIVFVITPPKSQFLMTPNKLGLTIEDYANCEKKIAAKYGVPVLDLTDTFQFTSYLANDDFKKKWMPDQAHPTVAGYDEIGKRVVSFIGQLMPRYK